MAGSCRFPFGVHTSLQLAACCVMLALRPLGFSVVGIFTVEFQEYFQSATIEQATWFTACHMGVTVIVSAVLIGFLLERFGAMITLAFSALLGTCGLVLTAFINTLPVIYIGYGFMAGWCFVSYMLIGNSILQLSFGEHRNLATGMAFTCMSLGSFLWPAVLRLVIDVYCWQGAMLLLGAINLHVIPFLIILPKGNSKEEFIQSKLPPRECEITEEQQKLGSNEVIKPIETSWNGDIYQRSPFLGGQVEMKKTALQNGVSDKQINSSSNPGDQKHTIPATETHDPHVDPSTLRRRQYFLFILFAFSQLCNAFPNYALYLFIPIRCVIQGYTKRQAAGLISIMNITGCMLRLFAGALGDVQCINVFYVISAATLACGLSLVLSIFCDSFVSLAVFVGVFGSATAFFVTLVQAAVKKIGGSKELNVGLSMVFAAEGMCGLIFPISGWLLDSVGSIDLLFIVLGISGLLGGTVVLITGLLHKKLILDKATAGPVNIQLKT